MVDKNIKKKYMYYKDLVGTSYVKIFDRNSQFAVTLNLIKVENYESGSEPYIKADGGDDLLSSPYAIYVKVQSFITGDGVMNWKTMKRTIIGVYGSRINETMRKFDANFNCDSCKWLFHAYNVKAGENDDEYIITMKRP